MSNVPHMDSGRADSAGKSLARKYAQPCQQQGHPPVRMKRYAVGATCANLVTGPLVTLSRNTRTHPVLALASFLGEQRPTRTFMIRGSSQTAPGGLVGFYRTLNGRMMMMMMMVVVVVEQRDTVKIAPCTPGMCHSATSRTPKHYLTLGKGGR